jgi:hypothetical protein
MMVFLLHSPFLEPYSLAWLPVCVIMCLAEERHLLIRYSQAYEESVKRTAFFLSGRSL